MVEDIYEKFLIDENLTIENISNTRKKILDIYRKNKAIHIDISEVKDIDILGFQLLISTNKLFEGKAGIKWSHASGELVKYSNLYGFSRHFPFFRKNFSE